MEHNKVHNCILKSTVVPLGDDLHVLFGDQKCMCAVAMPERGQGSGS